MKEKQDQYRGFTLVELSIVLVIVGLLIGGILVGQNMIESAKIHRFIAEIQEYELAAKKFKSIYKYWPGDFPQGYAKFGCGTDTTHYATGCNGDANGVLHGPSYQEAHAFWVHLGEASMINKRFVRNVNIQAEASQIPGTNIPKFSLDPKLVVFAFSYPSWLYGVAPLQPQTNGFYFGICTIGGCNPTYVPVVQSMAIDKKIDDGLPGTGYFKSLRGSAETRCVTTLSPSTARYIPDDTVGCTIGFTNLAQEQSVTN